MYRVTQGTFRTPRGRQVALAYREDTNDYNTLRSCLDEDEYGLKELDLTGTALDIGAYIGGVTVALAIDNPELKVIAVEAVPPNVELLKENLERAGVAERVTVLHAAAGKGKTAKVRWAFKGNYVADHHAFVGNAVMPQTEEASHSELTLDVVTLNSLAKDYGPFSFAKVDCEGCEYDFLRGRGLLDIACIRGEEHFGRLPLPGFDVTYSQDNAPRGFSAVRRA
jgi:FkbM family methyltransferase